MWSEGSMEYLKRKWANKDLLQKRLSIVIYIATALVIFFVILGFSRAMTFNLVNLIIVLLMGLIEILLGLHNLRDSKPAAIVYFIAGIVICYLAITGFIRTI